MTTFTMFLLTRFLVCLSAWNFVIDFKLTSRWARDLEIWTRAQKWMTMNENATKEEKNEKDERKMKKMKKAKTKN